MKVIKDFKDLSLLRSEILNGNPNGVDILRIDGQAFSTDKFPYMVRRAVAKLELTPSIPTLAKMDVKAANSAESSANTSHNLLVMIFFI